MLSLQAYYFVAHCSINAASSNCLLLKIHHDCSLHISVNVSERFLAAELTGLYSDSQETNAGIRLISEQCLSCQGLNNVRMFLTLTVSPSQNTWHQQLFLSAVPSMCLSVQVRAEISWRDILTGESHTSRSRTHTHTDATCSPLNRSFLALKINRMWFDGWRLHVSMPCACLMKREVFVLR